MWCRRVRWGGVLRAVCMLVRRLLLRGGRRRSRSLRLWVCRGCSVGCTGGRRAWPTLFDRGLPLTPPPLTYLPFPTSAFTLLSPTSRPHHQARTSIIINEDLKHMIRQTYSGIHPPTTTHPVRSFYVYIPSIIHAYPLPFILFTPFSSLAHVSSTPTAVPLRPLIKFKF